LFWSQFNYWYISYFSMYYAKLVFCNNFYFFYFSGENKKCSVYHHITEKQHVWVGRPTSGDLQNWQLYKVCDNKPNKTFCATSGATNKYTTTRCHFIKYTTTSCHFMKYTLIKKSCIFQGRLQKCVQYMIQNIETWYQQKMDVASTQSRL
jgi:hypothetical protein